MLLAQLTDTHILEPGSNNDHLLDNSARLAAAVERLGQETLQPRAVLATGDLTDHGTEAEMGILLDLLEPIDAPILAVPGNHDVRETFAPAFDLPWASDTNLSWVVDVDDLRVIGLDTIVPGSHGGHFDDERRQWLTAALTRPPTTGSSSPCTTRRSSAGSAGWTRWRWSAGRISPRWYRVDRTSSGSWPATSIGPRSPPSAGSPP
ncbi:MAG: metallophosphoesterase [Actinomycetota bacterium]